MTVIAAVAKGERVWMACDTLAVNGWDQKHDAGSKIVRRDVAGRDCLLGVSGDGALISMMRWDLEIPTPNGDLDEWALRVAQALTSLCRDAKPDLLNESGKGINACFLLGFGGRLWSLATNQAWPIDLFAAIGSGDEYALGALFAAEEERSIADPTAALTVAVQAACKFDLHCGGDRLCIETA